MWCKIILKGWLLFEVILASSLTVVTRLEIRFMTHNRSIYIRAGNYINYYLWWSARVVLFNSWLWRIEKYSDGFSLSHSFQGSGKPLRFPKAKSMKISTKKKKGAVFKGTFIYFTLRFHWIHLLWTCVCWLGLGNNPLSFDSKLTSSSGGQSRCRKSQVSNLDRDENEMFKICAIVTYPCTLLTQSYLCMLASQAKNKQSILLWQAYKIR